MTTAIHHNTMSTNVSCFVYKAGQNVLKTVQSVALAVFQSIAYCVTFPLRYMGSKTWSLPGVVLRTPYVLFKKALGLLPPTTTVKDEIFCSKHRQSTPTMLSVEEAQKHLPFLAAAGFAHSSNADTWVKPLGYTPIVPKDLNIQDAHVETREACFFDPQSGLKIVLAQKEDTVLIAFGTIGAYISETPDQAKYHKKMSRHMNIQAIKNWAGIDIAIADQAAAFFEKLTATPALKDKKIIFVGHCFGGMLAQFLSLKYRKKSYCYNCLHLGPGLQWKLGDKALENAEDYVTQVFAKGDFLHDVRGRTLVDRGLSLLGLRTRGHFGKRYFVPSHCTKTQDIHSYIIGSVMQHMGLHNRTVPSTMTSEELAVFNASTQDEKT